MEDAAAVVAEPAPDVPLCPFELDLPGLLHETPNECYGHWNEYVAALVVACSLPMLRFVLDRTLFQGVMTLLLGKGAGEAKLVKAKESLWKFSVYVALVTLAVMAVGDENGWWFADTWQYWAGCVSVPCTAPFLPRVKLLYVAEMGYYLQEVPMLFIWATRRKDFWQLLAHHFATLGLIFYSLELGITRVGAAIYLLHDINDPFMEIAKVCRYAKLHDLSLGFFIAFVVSWFVSRVYFYPAVVIRSTLFEISAIADDIGVSIEPHWTILNILLIFLLVLHIYWSYLILRIIVRQLTHGETKDVREDDDDSDDDDGDGKKRA